VLVYDVSDYDNDLAFITIQVLSFIMIFQVPKYTSIIVTKGAEGGQGIGLLTSAAAGAAGGAKFMAQQRIMSRLNAGAKKKK